MRRRLSAQSGAAAPLLIIILLIGLVFGVYLVQNKTNLFSKASVSSPVATEPPIFEDDFSTYKGWFIKDYAETASEYLQDEQLLRVLIKKPPYRQTSHRSFELNEWTVMFDFELRGNSDSQLVGVEIGDVYKDTYRFYVLKQGGARLRYDSIGGVYESVFDSREGLRLMDNRIYKMRVDRSLTNLKAWLSEDNGSSWRLAAQLDLDPSKATGKFMGFVTYSGTVGQNFAEARFDNLKMYRLGALPEPGGPQGSPTPTIPPLNNIGIDEDSIRTEYIGDPGNIRVKFHAEGTGETNLIVVYVFQGDRQVAVLGSVKPSTWSGEDPFPNLPDGTYTIRYVATKVSADGSEKTGEIVDRAYSRRTYSDPFAAQ